MLATHCTPGLGEKQNPWEKQEKPLLTQTRVLGHATPLQCLAMQDAGMETVAPGAIMPQVTEQCTNGKGSLERFPTHLQGQSIVGSVSMSTSIVSEQIAPIRDPGQDRDWAQTLAPPAWLSWADAFFNGCLDP